MKAEKGQPDFARVPCLEDGVNAVTLEIGVAETTEGR